MYAKLIGTGGYLPKRVVSNHELAQTVDTNDTWIRTRTGITQRHIAEGESTCDMAEQAARQALAHAQVTVSQLDLIIVATTTPDRIFPSSACLLQARLGNQGAAAFDLQAVCGGFIYAFSVADQFIRSGSAQTALVVGAESYSRIVDWQDRSTCVLFGDGAGAVVLQADPTPGVLATRLHADGQYAEALTVPGYVADNHIVGGSGYTQMQGQEVFKFAVQSMSQVAQTVLTAAQCPIDAVNWYIPHQANIRIIQAVAKKLAFPMQQVITTVAEHGNTSAASVPLALHQGVSDGRIQAGQTLLMTAVGGGFTWGGVVLRY